MKVTILLLIALIGAASANLLNATEIADMVAQINIARSETNSSLPALVIDEYLSAAASNWTDKCNPRPDRKLKYLYSSVHNLYNGTTNPTVIVGNWIRESRFVMEFLPHELGNAGNWSRLLWVNSTKIGCSLSKCGEKYLWGCLLSPKGGFPGRMPFIPHCKPKQNISCSDGCGTYFDGCRKIVCGPTCNNNTRREVSLYTPYNGELPFSYGRVVRSIISETEHTSRDNVVRSGSYLNCGQSITSSNGVFELVMQCDGNFVLYEHNRGALWANMQSYRGGQAVDYYFAMQGDGNMVIYDHQCERDRGCGSSFCNVPECYQWATMTCCGDVAPYTLAMQDDANLVLYDNNGRSHWDSGTYRPPVQQNQDWRYGSDIITDVKDQGQCGSCWAFAGVSTIESVWAKFHGDRRTLSAQQVLSCSTNPRDGSRAGTCNGGVVPYVFSWAVNSYVIDESDFPYQANDAIGCHGGDGHGVHGSNGGIRYISDAYHPENPTDQNTIISALQNYGPLVVYIRVESPFYSYSGGLFTNDCDGGGINHAVQLIGYGRDSASGQDYWVLRNQWGTGWGNGGYMLIPRGRNFCRVEQYVYSFIPA